MIKNKLRNNENEACINCRNYSSLGNGRCCINIWRASDYISANVYEVHDIKKDIIFDIREHCCLYYTK